MVDGDGVERAIIINGNSNNGYAIQLLDSVSSSRAIDMPAEAKAMSRAVYSPQFLSSNYGSRPFTVLWRTLSILVGLGGFALKLLFDDRKAKINQNKRLRAIELRRTLTRLGLTFVKIGLGLSTRPDLCPPEYLGRALATTDEEAFACIERELGVPLESIYSSISPTPIAAASLGQVYKARLKSFGQLLE